jgi:lambda repressor-like predicted transcriptional regulator
LCSFENFLADMGVRPSDKHTIERIDNDKGYAPDNCVWATRTVQGRNRSDNRRVVFRGEEMTVADLVERTGVPRRTLYNRLDAGWSIDRAAAEPSRGGLINLKPHTGAKLDEGKVKAIRIRAMNGETQAALAREYGVSTAVINKTILRKSWRRVP